MDQTFNDQAIAILGSPLRWFTAPTLVGCLLNWFLFGSLTVQVYDYFLRFHANDRIGLKCLVYGLYIAETVGTALVTVTSYEILLGSWGDVVGLLACPASGPPNLVVSNSIAFIVQLFFAWRITCLRQTLFAKIGAGLTVASAIFSLIASMLFLKEYIKNRDANLKVLTETVNLWILSAFVCNFIIAATMVSVLWRARAATNYQQTKTVLNHLIVHTIETGGLTAIVATVEMGLFIYSPHSYLHLSMFYIIGRVYSNSLVASVNGRHRMRLLLDAGADHACVASLHLPPTVPGDSTRSYSDSSRTASQPGFMVLMKTTVHTDETSSVPSKVPSSSDLHQEQKM
ncbi:hypothetical protein BDN72DRAFT_836897 [Pluteus cervinus]|uniref:Uncharacterized protein n=1 Tax=Pluteus cervinus TaxID=181527 RepID=A0ACD3B2Z6_9AGAR|nr:hypothetical protein BDN72DRAFT_836897 [Pluteus cervinus]